MTDVQQAAVADNKARRDARNADQKARFDNLSKDRQEQIKTNQEKMQADSKLRPTPTIEEVQKAMAGQNVDQKEPDGSPEQNTHHHTVNAGAQIEVGRKTPEAQKVIAPPSGDKK